MIMKLIAACLLVFSLGANAAWHLDQMNVPQAWAVTHGEGVTVGIVGSGDSHDTIVEAAIKQVAPNAQTTFCIMRRTDSKNMANCIKSLADGGADIVNVSYVPSWWKGIIKAADYARSRGALVVWSAGNLT